MELLQLECVIETAKTGSMNRAAAGLSMTRSSLNKAICEIEQEYGITIFERRPRGVNLTPEGNEFIKHARKVIEQVTTLDDRYKHELKTVKRFSVCVPSANYISEAFSVFTRSFNSENTEMIYKETSTAFAVNNVASSKSDIGIIRYPTAFDEHYSAVFAEKDLKYDYINEFVYSIAVNKNSPLAAKDKIDIEDLAHFTEIVYLDPYARVNVPDEERTELLNDAAGSRIFLNTRTSMFDILRENNMTYMWVSSVSDEFLGIYDAVKLECSANYRLFRDVLIYRNGYTLGIYDKLFLDAVRNVLKNCSV